MATHSRPYNNTIPTKIKTKSPNLEENPLKKAFPIASSNKSESAINKSPPKSRLFMNPSPSTSLTKNLNRIFMFFNKSIKRRKFPVKSTDKRNYQKLPPYGLINSRFMKSKKNSWKNSLADLKAKSRSFTWSTGTLLLSLTKKIREGNLLIIQISHQNIMSKNPSGRCQCYHENPWVFRKAWNHQLFSELWRQLHI